MNKLLLIVFASVTAIAAPPPRIKSLTCTKVLTVGQTGACVITLTGKAPKKGSTFRISVNSTELIIPATNVTVSPGQTTASFPIKHIAPLQPIASR